MRRLNITKLDFKKLNGKIPAIVQDVETKAVLMLGFMNKEAVKKTIKNKRVTFWSRSKRRLWEKGEISGNTLQLISIVHDCDYDTLLVMSKPKGPTCHTGAYSCFGTKKEKGVEFLTDLLGLITTRKKDLPKNSYTSSLFKSGLARILAKIEEESDEVLKAAKSETRERLVEETSDLLYHLFVLLAQKSISLYDIIQELDQRKNKSAKDKNA